MRQLIEQMLDAMDKGYMRSGAHENYVAAITAARAYLAQPEQSEPVATVVGKFLTRNDELRTCIEPEHPLGTKLYTQPKAPEQSEPLAPVGEVQHLHELNDDWVQHLPIGTKLYSEKDVNDWMNAQVTAQTMEASCLNNVILSLEAELATIKATVPTPQPKAPEQSEPYAYEIQSAMCEAELSYSKGGIKSLIKPLYTHPAPQPKAPEPLTDEQIDNIIKQHTGGFIGGMHFAHLARAIEAAHGIGAFQ